MRTRKGHRQFYSQKDVDVDCLVCVCFTLAKCHRWALLGPHQKLVLPEVSRA